MHEFIERQAGSETKTTYIDGVQFAQAMIDAGVSREELTQKMPDVAAQLDDAVATGTDVEIPTPITRQRLRRPISASAWSITFAWPQTP